MNLLSYISSWIYDNSDNKDKFIKDVIPEIENYKVNKQHKKVIQQVKITPTRQKSIEIMENVKVELLLTPKKTYVVIENDRSRFVKPRISSKINMKYLKYYNRMGINQKQIFMKKNNRFIYQQPKKFKKI